MVLFLASSAVLVVAVVLFLRAGRQSVQKEEKMTAAVVPQHLYQRLAADYEKQGARIKEMRQQQDAVAANLELVEATLALMKTSSVPRRTALAKAVREKDELAQRLVDIEAQFKTARIALKGRTKANATITVQLNAQVAKNARLAEQLQEQNKAVAGLQQALGEQLENIKTVKLQFEAQKSKLTELSDLTDKPKAAQGDQMVELAAAKKQLEELKKEMTNQKEAKP